MKYPSANNSKGMIIVMGIHATLNEKIINEWKNINKIISRATTLHSVAIGQLKMFEIIVNKTDSVNIAGKKCTALSSLGKNL